MTATEGKFLDNICEQVDKPKSAEAYTWRQVWEGIIWKHGFYIELMHFGLAATFIIPIWIWTLFIASEEVDNCLESTIRTIILCQLVFVVGHGTFVGITAGAHRLWSHRTYKANLPLRILPAILYTVIGMYELYNWVRDHRVHHKYSETGADPHNARRGFFFSHMGWIMAKRNPECIRRGREIDMKDIRADAVVMFQRK